MATTLPVPIEFSLPEGWVSAPPDEVNAPGAAFVGIRMPVDPAFTPNITIGGEVRPAATGLEDVADEAIARLMPSAENLRTERRNEMGTADNPAYTQQVGMRQTVNGQLLDLKQFQVFLGMGDVEDPSRRAVIHIALTCTDAQFQDAMTDFQEFVKTVKPDQQDEAATGR